jgi:hypothetical protein
MDYDGLSSPESQQTREVVPHSLLNAPRFAILWHAMPPKKPSLQVDNVSPNLAAKETELATVSPLEPVEIATESGKLGATAHASENQGINAENRASHFDLMLEKSGRLVTFELFQLPIPGERFPVRRLAEHRIDYLDYEGPISGDRGHVTQWTAGHYLTALESEHKWILELYSPRLSARIVLLRPTSDTILDQTMWHLRASRWNIRN